MFYAQRRKANLFDPRNVGKFFTGLGMAPCSEPLILSARES